jgi:hypothetical protein
MLVEPPTSPRTPLGYAKRIYLPQLFMGRCYGAIKVPLSRICRTSIAVSANGSDLPVEIAKSICDRVHGN